MQLHDLAIRLSGCSTTRFVRCDPPFFLFQEKSFRALNFVFVEVCRHRLVYTRRFRLCPKTVFLKLWSTSMNLGGTGIESTTAVVWNWIFFVGCEPYCSIWIVIWPFFVRYCLEKLGVVNVDDHKALVIRVFWRFVQTLVWHRLIVEPSFQIPQRDACSAIDVLARTSRFTWCLGSGWLPLLALLVGCSPASWLVFCGFNRSRVWLRSCRSQIH